MKVQLWSEHRLRLNGTSFQKEFLQALIFFRYNSENDKKRQIKLSHRPSKDQKNEFHRTCQFKATIHIRMTKFDSGYLLHMVIGFFSSEATLIL